MNHPQDAVADRAQLRVALLGCALPEERFDEVTANDAGERMAPRPLGRGDFDVAFPSKVLEYVATGNPVVSTRLRGIPNDYWEYVVPCKDNPASLADAIVESAREDVTVATARSDFVARGKTAPAQGRRLVKFLEGIVGER